MRTIFVIWKHKKGWTEWQDHIYLACKSLKEAKKILLIMLNMDYNTNYHNWGLPKANKNIACSSWKYGACYRYDKWYYEIEEIEHILPINDFKQSCIYEYENMTRREYKNTLNEQLKWNPLYN